MALIRLNLDDVNTRLAALGLTEAELLQAIGRGMLARSESTPNHPPLNAGFVTWSNTVCALREVLIPKGWSRSDEGNYSTVVHPSGSFAIAVVTGDENTASADGNPMTKSPKGPSTRNAVAVNANQVLLFPEIMLAMPGAADARITWLLLVNVVGSKVKSELSLPINCEGKVDGWEERLILSDLDFDSGASVAVEPLLPNLPDIDIEIRRKA